MKGVPSCLCVRRVRCRPKLQRQPLPPSPIPERAGKNAETQDRCSSAGNSKKYQSTPEGQNWAQAQANPCPFTPRKKRRTCPSGSAMLQGGAQELNAGLGPPASREWLESRMGACTGDPEASLSPGPDPGPSSPKPGPGMCLGEGHAGRDAASREGEGTRSEAKVTSLFRAHRGSRPQR